MHSSCAVVTQGHSFAGVHSLCILNLCFLFKYLLLFSTVSIFETQTNICFQGTDAMNHKIIFTLLIQNLHFYPAFSLLDHYQTVLTTIQTAASLTTGPRCRCIIINQSSTATHKLSASLHARYCHVLHSRNAETKSDYVSCRCVRSTTVMT